MINILILILSNSITDVIIKTCLFSEVLLRLELQVVPPEPEAEELPVPKVGTAKDL